VSERTYEFHLADVFTTRRFGGNQLAVLTDARGLSDAEMQAVAQEFGFSETTFVLPPDDPAHTCRVRIFTPAEELPFAGHPTVGTAAVLAAVRGTGDGRLVFEEGVGPVAVDVAGTHSRLTVTAPFRSAEPGPAPAAVAAALSLAAEDVAETWFGGVGVPFGFVRLSGREAVDRAVLDRAAWRAGLAGAWSPHLYVFAGSFTPGAHLYARSFVPDIGIGEDPATGSAAAGLVASLARRAAAGGGDGEVTLTIDQGVAMGRPSRLEAAAAVRGGEVASVSVGGHTVLVGRGTLTL
jgi:trans-2,3-dihydro-3-hydroxyanthranilate isomerase